jgi:beta-phosphoglucomutase-like phosphatase (HAD superfamily)
MEAGMALDLLLFDLDNTLVHSTDLEGFRGAAGTGRRTPSQIQALIRAIHANPNRHHYSEDDLLALAQGRRIGVFTRSPRAYATTVLAECFPRVQWACLVAYEDVQNTKPHPDGIWLAMNNLGIQDIRTVAVVGDEKADIIAAYRAGCWAILEQGAWPNPRTNPQYHAIERVADVIVNGPSELRSVVADPASGLPVLELGGERPTVNLLHPCRYDAINHFIPFEIERGSAWVHALGRSFSDYELIERRRAWHRLTQEIEQNKDAEVFPAHWINALRAYLYHSWPVQHIKDTVVTVIPFKPGRQPRLERLLLQLQRSDEESRIHPMTPMSFVPDVLRYLPGAQSHHGAHLSREQRFINVRDHLQVARPDQIRGKSVIVIDDVVTTGASLIYAFNYLKAAGAEKVECVALAKAVGPE